MKAIVMISLLFMSACTTSYQTAEAFWLSQGERLGSRGYSIDSSALETMKEKVPFKKEAYIEGYKKGLNVYCDPFQAFNKGISGVRYTGQCDNQKEAIMIKVEWQRGWEAFLSHDPLPR